MSFPRKWESDSFSFSCFQVSGNFQTVIPAKVG
ncbi:transposase, partial [Neisseria gonorrhoeae]